MGSRMKLFVAERQYRKNPGAREELEYSACAVSRARSMLPIFRHARAHKVLTETIERIKDGKGDDAVMSTTKVVALAPLYAKRARHSGRKEEDLTMAVNLYINAAKVMFGNEAYLTETKTGKNRYASALECLGAANRLAWKIGDEIKSMELNGRIDAVRKEIYDAKN